MMKLKSLELFSGAGGLATGLSQAGFMHTALLEWNKHACDSLRANFKNVDIIEGDVRDFNFKNYSDVDIISGGPPCQPFSLGGKAKGSADDRDMFPYAIRGIREIQPKAFVFENVKGLLRPSFSEYFNYIILQLTYPEIVKKKSERWERHLVRLQNVSNRGEHNKLRYKVEFRLINAANYGIPQKRERVIIVGIKEGLGVKWSYPRETHTKEKLLWDKFVTGDYWRKHNVPKSEFETVTASLHKSIERLKSKYGFFEPQGRPWVTVRDALKGLPSPVEDHSILEHEYKEGAKSYPGHTGSYIDDPSKTIKAGDHGVPGGENMIRFKNGKVRYFTIREAKRIQTFPEEYKIEGSWSEGMRQLGNAVPVELGRIIGDSLLRALTREIVSNQKVENIEKSHRLLVSQ